MLAIFSDMCLSPHVVHKGIQENKCGGDTPRQLRRDPIAKIMKFGKQWTKNRACQSWTEMGLRAGHLASYMGRLAHHSATLPRALSTVRYEPNTLCFYMFRFPFQTELKIH